MSRRGLIPNLKIRNLKFNGRGKIPRHHDRTCFHCNKPYTPTNANQKYCGSYLKKTGCSWIVFKAQKVQSRKRNRYKRIEHWRKMARKYAKKTYLKLKARGYYQTEEYKKKARERFKKRYYRIKKLKNEPKTVSKGVPRKNKMGTRKES